ncbi:Aminocyclopropanecarboxylate oxidase [Handroanthus impetiginosus]|uniref:Aminocyclopropanecarboxylate oxidase n=1 Tax=Handroanthus impetiginosus TaxID=429701 RepID=A0A2G9GTQ4_9LAMI|nr:Aminocyclopropanecarboxylate oxidase [Handroanthus impetiginosus]
MYGDLGEVMEGCNKRPSDFPNFKILTEDYVNRCTDLCGKIMRGIALALGAPMDTFEEDRARDPFWVLHVIGYPVVYHANGKEMPKLENDVGCGAHTDYGLVNQEDDINALQVRNSDGEWISVILIPSTFVCNIGDMLKILTNDLYETTLHRVINSSPKYGVCVAYLIIKVQFVLVGIM